MLPNIILRKIKEDKMSFEGQLRRELQIPLLGVALQRGPKILPAAVIANVAEYLYADEVSVFLQYSATRDFIRQAPLGYATGVVEFFAKNPSRENAKAIISDQRFARAVDYIRPKLLKKFIGRLIGVLHMRDLIEYKQKPSPFWLSSLEDALRKHDVLIFDKLAVRETSIMRANGRASKSPIPGVLLGLLLLIPGLVDITRPGADDFGVYIGLPSLILGALCILTFLTVFFHDRALLRSAGVELPRTRLEGGIIRLQEESIRSPVFSGLHTTALTIHSTAFALRVDGAALERI